MAELHTAFQDGHYDLSEIIDSVSKDFPSEKSLCDFLEDNIEIFCKDGLGVDYKNHIREYALSEQLPRRAKGNKRVDFLIITKQNERIGVECKNPQTPGELSFAVGQALTYMTAFELRGSPLSRIIIVSTKIDSIIPFTIDRFNLPISFMAMDKTKLLTFRNGSAKRK